MQFKNISAFLLLTAATCVHAKSNLLDSYDAIKKHLLDGGKISIIVNNKTDCKLVSQYGPIPFSPNTYGMDVASFVIKAKNGDIELSSSTDLNGPNPEKNIPPNFHNLNMRISPQGTITIEETGNSLVDYSTVVAFTTACVIENNHQVGVKFIPH